MILDAYLRLSAAQAVTADAASTNTIDLGALTYQRKVAVGKAMALIFAITAIGTNTGSAKLLAIQSAAANLGSPQTIGQIDLVTADIAVGKIYVVPLSFGTAPLRYLGAYYDITGTVDFTVNCDFVPLSYAVGVYDAYARGYTIDLS